MDKFSLELGVRSIHFSREKYRDNLSKELPRIPCVKKEKDFLAFSEAGRKLAKLHLDYEKVEKYPVKLLTFTTLSKPEHYYVRQMKFAKKEDKTVLYYNEFITISGIPPEAYEYIVNGKSALENTFLKLHISIF